MPLFETPDDRLMLLGVAITVVAFCLMFRRSA